MKTCSILMLSFNGSQDAIEACHSFKEQEKYLDQIFLMDNGSNHENKNFLQQTDKPDYLKIIDHPENLGFAGGFNHLFNHALKESSSQYFLILNNDTIASPTLLEKLLEVASPEKVISPMILWHRDRETIIQSAGEFDTLMMKMVNIYEGKKASDLQPKPYEIGQTDGCCFLIHRSWLEKGFRFLDDFFMYYEDVEFFLRLRKAGVTFIYQAETYLLHKEYGSSGNRETPSALRHYYFYRNRLMLAKMLHSGLKKWRIYYLIYQLAKEKYRSEVKDHPETARAIWEGFGDFYKGIVGKGPYPKNESTRDL